MFRQNFSTGMNYLRRRFSSDDLYHERNEDFDAALAGAGVVGSSSSADVGGYGRNSVGSDGGASNMPYAPCFPSLSSVQGMTRGILSQAAAAASSAVTAASHGTLTSNGPTTPQRIVCSNERCKILLIIDDKHTDWYTNIGLLLVLPHLTIC